MKKLFKKIGTFFKEVKQEMKKVKWPDKKYIVKYTIVTLAFVIVLSLFFYLIFILMAFIRG